jgi:4'-phosphopantetheinyl transferase EntD
MGLLDELVGRDAIAVEATAEDWTARLAPEEQPAVARAVDRRRREFAAGRACARRALARLGSPVAALPSGDDRVPRWPDGVVGSISHTRGWCAAVVAWRERLRGIGLDGERIMDAERAEILPRIASAEEWAAVAAPASDQERRLIGTLLFCAKEAVFKCQFPLTGHFLEFDDVAIELAGGRELEAGTFTARIARGAVPAIAGRFLLDGDLVIALALLP